MKEQKIFNKLLAKNIDADIKINTGEYNGLSTISISQQNNKCTLNMATCIMISGGDLIKSLEEILDCYKNNTDKNTFYSYGDIINILLRKLFEQEMCEDEDLYKALDDWYWGDEDDEQEDE